MQAFRSFDLSPVVFAPVVVVFVLCALRVNVKLTMLVSLVVASSICIFVQGMAPAALAQALVDGYHAADPAIARLADGGGVVSMGEVAAVVAVASTYAGLFSGTGLVDGLGRVVSELSERTTPFVGVLVTSVATAAIACDQVVAIMLVRQLCERCERANVALALDLESSVAIIPAVIPWSTSVVSIAAFTGIPTKSVLFAFLPLLVPAWCLVISLWQRSHPDFIDSRAAQVMGLVMENMR